MNLTTFFLLLIFSHLGAASTEKLLDDANQFYLQGLQTHSFEKRMEAFNEALKNYLFLAEKIDSPALNLAIGNCFFQLREYSWAILYTEKTLKSQPNNQEARQSLYHAYQKLGFSWDSQRKKTANFKSVWNTRLIFLSMLFLFITYSLNIWFPSIFLLKELSYFSAMLLFLFLSQMLFFYYSEPIEGILVQGTAIYRQPDRKQPKLLEKPLSAGLPITLLESNEQASWFKVMNQNGIVGYIPAEAFRII
jgi:tetratricopeptide (TPR) repeat protein